MNDTADGGVAVTIATCRLPGVGAGAACTAPSVPPRASSTSNVFREPRHIFGKVVFTSLPDVLLAKRAIFLPNPSS